MDDNEQLVAAFQSGDAESGNRLVLQLELLVRRVLRKRYRGTDAELTEDLLQAGRTGVFLAAKSYKTGRGAKFSTYAWTVVGRKIERALELSYLTRKQDSSVRKKKKEKIRSTKSLDFDSGAGSFVEILDSGSGDPLNAVLDQEIQNELWSAVSSLPGRMPRVIGGLLKGDREYEIAEAEGITKQRVNQLKKDGLKRLQVILQEVESRPPTERTCKHCGSEGTKKNGTAHGRQRRFCKNCKRTFSEGRGKSFRLPARTVNAVVRRLDMGASYRAIAAEVGVSRGAIGRIQNVLGDQRKCRTCGKSLPRGRGVKRHQYCSNACQRWRYATPNKSKAIVQ